MFKEYSTVGDVVTDADRLSQIAYHFNLYLHNIKLNRCFLEISYMEVRESPNGMAIFMRLKHPSYIIGVKGIILEVLEDTLGKAFDKAVKVFLSDKYMWWCKDLNDFGYED